jgi:dynein heavy chain
MQHRHPPSQVPEADEVFAAYELAHASIEQFMHNTHNEWFGTIENGISRELSATLMTADKSQGGATAGSSGRPQAESALLCVSCI